MIWEGVVKFAGSMEERFVTMGVATNGNKGWVVRWFFHGLLSLRSRAPAD